MGTLTADVKTTTGSRHDDGDRIAHNVHRCGVEPVLTRCGAKPREGYVPGKAPILPPPGALLCNVCEDLKSKPCKRCGQ